MPAMWPELVSTYFDLAADVLRRQIGRAPRRDVIVLGAEHVERRLNLPEVDRRVVDDEGVRLDDRVVQVARAQVLRVHRDRHARRVVVPGENVERRRLLALEPVVDDVAPDQIAGAHPVEGARHLRRLEIAALVHLLSRAARSCLRR